MKFQRHLLSKRPLPQGYSAPSANIENCDVPIFQLGGGPVDLQRNQDNFPERFSIQARLKPIIYEPDEAILVTLQTQGQTLTPYQLYRPEKLMERYGCLRSLEIHFENFLSKEMREIPLKEERTLIYKKDFINQTASPISSVYEIQGGRGVMTPPGVSGKQALWAYGGYYQEGCQLQEIEQLLFTPTREQSKTILHMSRVSNWHTKEHEVVFINPLEKSQKLSLLGEIEEGATKFEAFRGLDETGKAHFVVYQSFAIYQQDRLSDLVKIDFRKEKLS
jgi:hypothetical protein